MAGENAILRWSLLVDFFKLQRHLCPSWKSDSFWLFWTLILAASVEQFLAYKVGLITGGFYEILGNKEEKAFMHHCFYSLALILSITIFKSLRSFLSKILSVVWRKHLTSAIHQLYFHQLRFYKLSSVTENSIDNPDQRIASDVQIFCTSYSTIILDLLLSPILIAYYGYDAFYRATWIAPTGILGLFVISVVINRLLMSKVVSATVQHEKMEGYFRYAHANIRSNSESLAFCGHQACMFEKEQQHGKIKDVCSAQFVLYRAQLVLELATNANSYLASIASFLIIAPPIFTGMYDDLTSPQLSKMISETSFVCIYLAFQLSKLVEMSVQLSKLFGVSFRISQMIAELQKTDKCSSQFDDPHQMILASSGDDATVIQVEKLSVFTPDKNSSSNKQGLIENVSFHLKRGENLLIGGQSSSGKTSLMRVIAGLWDKTAGMCYVLDNAMFLPQNPYLCTDVSLRQQLTFPHKSSDDGIELKQLMLTFGLSHLLDTVDGDLDACPSDDWVKKLSPGEKQTLAFIRLLHHRPPLAFLDEASSAISVEKEALLYEYCISRNIQIVSIGHRPTLTQFHQWKLTLGLPNNGWVLAKIF